ncbi:DUF4321 domain-containing protein [Paenibacillus contaminans]|jgi:hypothetical protein|uniref:DUF4321 domain-containing protein n=1 Tax=Paenibacillus contaminans TaxID=450362 RepID=A0A329MQ16_9BACL|nr:DUF4321 domain-containing protein [Paenibacillus contaminans]RAV21985.1 DUF4321 domain-containing protein [Paenibacillus contaminans]
MKKSNWTLLLFIVIGLIAGAIITQLLADVPGISFLTKSAEISWHPKADLQVIRYDLLLEIRLNLISIIMLIAAIWIYRKL